MSRMMPRLVMMLERVKTSGNTVQWWPWGTCPDARVADTGARGVVGVGGVGGLGGVGECSSGDDGSDGGPVLKSETGSSAGSVATSDDTEPGAVGCTAQTLAVTVTAAVAATSHPRAVAGVAKPMTDAG
jgi:hypothetical protein